MGVIMMKTNGSRERRPVMINILLSIKKLFSVSKKKFPQTKKNEKEFVFKPCCRNCINNAGDFECYTYGLFKTPESLNDYCRDWDSSEEAEEEQEYYFRIKYKSFYERNNC